MPNRITDLVFPECAMRPERMASRDAAVSCANKTAKLSSAILLGVVIVIAIVAIASGGADYRVYFMIAGAATLAIANVVLAGTIAGRKWDANDVKIRQMMAMGHTDRAAAAETVVRENMQQEQLGASQKLANAASANAASNVWNTFAPRR